MPLIQLRTTIDAPVEHVFDLSRSIDAHMVSAQGTHERAVAGRTSGFIELGETVTWEARHFGIKQRLTVKITAMNRPHSFEDVMIQGAFRSMRHQHEFSRVGNSTRMSDAFHFSAPFGFFGSLAERLFLTAYMKRFLVKRNRILKQMAESNSTSS